MPLPNFEEVKKKYHELCDKRDALETEIQRLFILREQLEEEILMIENIAIYQYNTADRKKEFKDGKFQ